MSKFRWGRAAGVLVAASMLMAACGGGGDDGGAAAPDADGRQRVALAFVGPLTGDNANLGVNIRDGMRVAVDEWNARSDSYVYEIKEFDTQGDPAQAPGQKDRYVPDESIIGLVGPTFSGETKAVLPAIHEAGLVMVSPSVTNVDLPEVVPGTPVFHRVIPDDSVQAEGVTDYVIQVLDPEKVALIHDNTEYGKGLWADVVRLLNEAGVDTSTTDAVDPRSQDYSAAVNKVRAAGVDMVFYGGYYNEAGRLKKQLSDAGVEARFISGDGSLDPGFVVSSGAAGGEGALLTCPCRLATPDLPGKAGEFATRYQELIGRDPGTYSSEGYDAASILISGVEAGNDTRESLLEYVENLEPFPGVSKTIEFEENGNVKAGDVFVYEVRDGKITELGKSSELVQ